MFESWCRRSSGRLLHRAASPRGLGSGRSDDRRLRRLSGQRVDVRLELVDRVHSRVLRKTAANLPDRAERHARQLRELFELGVAQQQQSLPLPNTYPQRIVTLVKNG